MGYIASLLLAYMPDGRAFTAYLHVMTGKKKAARDFFIPIRLQGLIRAWDYLLGKKLPDVKNRIEDVGITTDEYFPDWVQSAFLAPQFHPTLKLRLFDRFVAFGPRALLSFGIVIMMVVRAILSASKESLLRRIKDPADDASFANCRWVMEKMDRYLITKTEYAKLRKASGADLKYTHG
jgi:hypothetical protein